LIEQAKGEIDDKINLDIKKEEELIEFQFPLKYIPSKYWDKVEVGND